MWYAACPRRGALSLHPERTLTLARLPLVVHPAPAPGRTFAFIFTGDGNWAMLVRGVARELARDGISSVGLKARTYLLQRRTPAEVARDVERVLRHYLDAWGAERVVLIGLSRGADLLPFAVRRFPVDLQRRVALLALLSPAPNANFRFRWPDLVGYHRRDDDLPVLPELEALAGTVPVLCINGTRDRAPLAPLLSAAVGEAVLLDAGHNLGRDHRAVAALIRARLERPR